MASHLPAIFRRLQALVFDKLPASFDIHSTSLFDRWRVGPELDGDIEGEQGQAAKPFLNAIIVSPVEPQEQVGDLAEASGQWTLPLDILFVYRRGPDLLNVAETWADPLHDILCQRQLRRLDNLTFHDSNGRKAGHVTGYRVAGPPDFYSEADNDALYGLGLACFRIRVEVELMTLLDPEYRARS